MRNEPWPTVACNVLPPSTKLGTNFVMLGSVVMAPYFLASCASVRSCTRSTSGLHVGSRMFRIAAGSSARISSGWLFA